MGTRSVNILYLSYDGMTDPLGQSQVLPYLTGLANRGYKITLVSFEKKERKKTEKVIRQLTQEASINWVPLNYTKRPPVVSTLIDIIKLIRVVQKLHREKNFSIVHCRSYITALVGLRLKRKCKIKFIFDMRGFWVDERVEGGIWNLSNPLFRWIYDYFKAKEEQFFYESDYIISLTNSGKAAIGTMCSNNTTPIEVIPCCVDSNHFNFSTIKQSELSELKLNLNIDSADFVLSYLGSVGTWYMLPEMLDFFKQLLLNRPNSIFLFITADDPTLILNSAVEKGIDKNKIKVIMAKRDEVPKMLSLSDLSIFFIKPVFSKIASSPTKLGEILSLGIPVICSGKVGDLEETVGQEVGMVINNFDKHAYQKAIAAIPNLLQNDRELIRNHAITRFNLEDGTKKYSMVYKHLLD